VCERRWRPLKVHSPRTPWREATRTGRVPAGSQLLPATTRLGSHGRGEECKGNEIVMGVANLSYRNMWKQCALLPWGERSVLAGITASQLPGDEPDHTNPLGCKASDKCLRVSIHLETRSGNSCLINWLSRGDSSFFEAAANLSRSRTVRPTAKDIDGRTLDLVNSCWSGRPASVEVNQCLKDTATL